MERERINRRTTTDETSSLLLEGNSSPAEFSYSSTEEVEITHVVGKHRKSRHDSIKRRIRYYFPILGWLPNYNPKDLILDFRAGLTVSCLLVPQCLSYGSLTNLAPIYGLFTALVPALTYVFLGTSRHASLGPEALVSMLVGALINDSLRSFGATHPDATEKERLAFAASIAMATSMLVGIMAFLLGVFQMGFLDSIISLAGLRGFISGAAIVIIIQQLISGLGLQPTLEELPAHHIPLDDIKYLFKHYGDAHALTAKITFGSLAFLFFCMYIRKQIAKKKKVLFFIEHKHLAWVNYFPEFLVLIIVMVLMSKTYNWAERGVKIFGLVESKLPGFGIPKIHINIYGKDVLFTAINITVIGVVESVIVSREYAIKNQYSVSSNRELVALGVSNFLGGMFSAYPAFASLSRSKLNDNSGAKSQLSGFFATIMTLGSLIWLLPYLNLLPKAALNAIIIVAVFGLLPSLPETTTFFIRVGAWGELILMVTVIVCEILFSLESGLLMAILLSVIIVIKRTNLPKIKLLGQVEGSEDDRYLPINDSNTDSQEYDEVVVHIRGILIICVEEPLYFANTGQLRARLNRLELFGDMRVHPSEDRRLEPVQAMIFEFSRMSSIDGSATLILLHLVDEYEKRNIRVLFVRATQKIKDAFANSGMLKEFDGCDNSTRYFNSVHAAKLFIESNYF